MYTDSLRLNSKSDAPIIIQEHLIRFHLRNSFSNYMSEK